MVDSEEALASPQPCVMDFRVDRAGNADMLALDEPSPAGAFAYNTILCNIKKSDLQHRPGWDRLGTSRSHVFRREL